MSSSSYNPTYIRPDPRYAAPKFNISKLTECEKFMKEQLLLASNHNTRRLNALAGDFKKLQKDLQVLRLAAVNKVNSNVDVDDIIYDEKLFFAEPNKISQQTVYSGATDSDDEFEYSDNMFKNGGTKYRNKKSKRRYTKYKHGSIKKSKKSKRTKNKRP